MLEKRLLRFYTRPQQTRCLPSVTQAMLLLAPSKICPKIGYFCALWGATGRELYFVSVDGNLMVASILQSAGSITVEGLHPLFRSPFITARVNTLFDVDPKDSQRLIGSVAPDASSLPLNVITNWTAELKKQP